MRPARPTSHPDALFDHCRLALETWQLPEPATGLLLLAPLAALFLFLHGWWNYHRLEKSVVEKMDQYYLNLSMPGREEYLLEGDEVFEVPYMASKLSVEAVPSRIYDASGRLIGDVLRSLLMG